MKKIILSSLMFLGIFQIAQAQTVTLTPSQDNTIFAESENSNGQGNLYAGKKCDGLTRRALIQFDVAGALPYGAVITSVSLSLNATASDGASSAFTLNRVIRSWGEGASSGADAGATAIAPDATWSDAMFETSPWTAVGGDFIATASATTTLPGVTGTYTWTSATMLQDVRSWLTTPSGNFGWVLRGNEASTCNATTFGSGEVGTAPVLTITYTCGVGGPRAICDRPNAYLSAAGNITLTEADIDGGSEAFCGGTLTSFAGDLYFDCSDIYVPTVVPSLIITGVYDGPLVGGLPKGVELFAFNDIPDLSIYGVGFANNGGGTDGIETDFPAVFVPRGTYIYVSSEAVGFNNWFGFPTTYVDGSGDINGDDAIELFMDGSVIDVFGQIAVDGTGTPWEYMDGWAYRLSNTGLDGITFDISHWSFSGPNSWDPELFNWTAAEPMPASSFYRSSTVGIPVTLTVTDEFMATSTCQTTVLVFDTIAPIMGCVGALTLTLDETGVAEIDTADITDGTVDACGLASLTISKSTFTCEDEGENVVVLIATDNHGNVDSCETIVTVVTSEVLDISEGVITQVSCADGEDGSVSLTVTGGAPEYTYDWDNDGTGDFDDLAILTGVGAGTYILAVQDTNGCVSEASFTIIEPDPIVLSFTATDESCPGANDGEIALTVVGGTPDYTFVWTSDDVDFEEDTEDLTGLKEGDYTLDLTDANGCEASLDVTISVIAEIDLSVTVDGETFTSNQAGATYQWIDCLDLSEIDGATNQEFTAITFGDYAVIVTIDGGCSDTSACYEFASDGINEQEFLELNVYPNPTEGLITIQLSENITFAEISVFDLKGSRLVNKTTSKSTEIIDLTQLENGVYLVEVKLENGIVTRKVTIQK